MAILVPDPAEINSLPQGLTQGERCLMQALCNALDDEWTVYVQPHLNGLRPDAEPVWKNCYVRRLYRTAR